MSKHKRQAYRIVRKGANLSRRAFSKAANLSDRFEKKANNIIHGTDPTIKIYEKVLFEKIYSEALPEIIPIHPALPLPGRTGAITLFIPSLQASSFFGGTATALILAGMLAIEKGMNLRIVETLVNGKSKPSDLMTFFESAGLLSNRLDIEILNLSGRKYNHYGYLDIHPEDIFIASAWWDAHLLSKLPLTKPYIYLIQDFEPIFYNNSTAYVLAEHTYSNDNFIPVCNTSLMKNFMAKQGYNHIKKNALSFEPAVNVGIRHGYYNPEKNTKRRLFLYGRPSVDRNLFHFALSCLDDLFTNQRLISSEWEIFMAGETGIADIVLSSGVVVQNLGKMSPENYYAFMRGVDIAFTPMLAPHPNYPTLEFASCGSAVVTTSYKNKQDLSSYSKNIFIGRPDLEVMTGLILKAANLSPKQRLENAQSSTIPDDWHKALGGCLREVTKTLSKFS